MALFNEHWRQKCQVWVSHFLPRNNFWFLLICHNIWANFIPNCPCLIPDEIKESLNQLFLIQMTGKTLEGKWWPWMPQMGYLQLLPKWKGGDVTQTLFELIVLSILEDGASLVAQWVKNLPAMWETWVWSLLGRSPGEGSCYPFQCSGLENSMDCTVHGVTKSWTRPSNFHLDDRSSLNWGSLSWRRFLQKATASKLLFKSLAFFSEQQSFTTGRWDGIKGELWLSLIPGSCGGWSWEPAAQTLCPLHSWGGPALGGGFYRIA